MAAPVFPGDGLPVHARDQGFTEVISQQMRVPDRLRVGSGPAGEDARGRDEDPHLAYSMQVPDRLSLIEAPDLNPRPMFSTPVVHGPQPRTGARWDGLNPSVRDALQSPLRRSHSDQAFGRSPLSTPTPSKQPLHVPPVRPAGRPPQHSDPPGQPGAPPSLLSPKSMLQAARTLGQQASQHLLQTVTQKYTSRFSGPALNPTPPPETPPHPEPSRRSVLEAWPSPEEDGGGDVEILVLRRQVLKMSRRLAALERQSLEHRQSELLLLTLLASACLLNGWLWLRR